MGDVFKGLGKEHLVRVREVISDPVLLRVLQARREAHRDTLESSGDAITVGRAQEMKWLLEIVPQQINRLLGVDNKPKGGVDE